MWQMHNADKMLPDYCGRVDYLSVCYAWPCVSVRAADAVTASSMNSVYGGQRLGAWKDGKGGSEREMWCAWCMAYMCVSLRHYYDRGERACGSKTRTMRMRPNTRETPGTYLAVPPRKQNHMLTSQTHSTRHVTRSRCYVGTLVARGFTSRT
jgi:hypothetical protein